MLVSQQRKLKNLIKIVNTIQEIIQSYKTSKAKRYVLLRWLMCPFSVMEKHLPRSGTIYDVGCGEGIMVQYVARVRPTRTVIGVDTDARRIKTAKQATRELENVDFKVQSALKTDFKRASGVIVSDFLHHISYEDQEKLFVSISKGLRKNGVFLIKEIDRADTIRRIMSRFWDWVFYPQDTIYYRDMHETVNRLNKMGFKVKWNRAVWYFPGSTNILACVKK